MNDQKNITSRLAVALLLSAALLVAPQALLAQDAGAYLEKLLAMYEKPFSADYDLTMSVSQGGMSMSMDGTGASKLNPKG